MVLPGVNGVLPQNSFFLCFKVGFLITRCPVQVVNGLLLPFCNQNKSSSIFTGPMPRHWFTNDPCIINPIPPPLFFFFLLPHYKPHLQVKGTSLPCYHTHGCVSPELPVRFVYPMRYWCCADNKVMAKAVLRYLQLIWSISLLSAPFVHSLLFFNLGGKDKSAEWHGEAVQNDVFSRKLKSIAICGGAGEAF